MSHHPRTGDHRATGTLVALAMCAVIGACSLTRPSPVKNTFLLDPPPPASAAVAKQATLRIGTFNVAAPYRDRGFVYRTGDVRYESDFYNEFFVSPAAMFAQSTTSALAVASLFTRVVPSGTVPDEGDLILEGFVTEFHADTRQSPAVAVVGIKFFLSRTAFPVAVVWSRDYREGVQLAAATPEALVRAWSEALGRVHGSLVRDLAGAELTAR